MMRVAAPKRCLPSQKTVPGVGSRIGGGSDGGGGVIGPGGSPSGSGVGGTGGPPGGEGGVPGMSSVSKFPNMSSMYLLRYWHRLSRVFGAPVSRHLAKLTIFVTATIDPAGHGPIIPL